MKLILVLAICVPLLLFTGCVGGPKAKSPVREVVRSARSIVMSDAVADFYLQDPTGPDDQRTILVENRSLATYTCTLSGKEGEYKWGYIESSGTVLALNMVSMKVYSVHDGQVEEIFSLPALKGREIQRMLEFGEGLAFLVGKNLLFSLLLTGADGALVDEIPLLAGKWTACQGFGDAIVLGSVGQAGYWRRGMDKVKVVKVPEEYMFLSGISQVRGEVFCLNGAIVDFSAGEFLDHKMTFTGTRYDPQMSRAGWMGIPIFPEKNKSLFHLRDDMFLSLDLIPKSEDFSYKAMLWRLDEKRLLPAGIFDLQMDEYGSIQGLCAHEVPGGDLFRIGRTLFDIAEIKQVRYSDLQWRCAGDMLMARRGRDLLIGRPPVLLQEIPDFFPEGDGTDFDCYGNIITVLTDGRILSCSFPDGNVTEYPAEGAIGVFTGSLGTLAIYEDGRVAIVGEAKPELSEAIEEFTFGALSKNRWTITLRDIGSPIVKSWNGRRTGLRHIDKAGWMHSGYNNAPFEALDASQGAQVTLSDRGCRVYGSGYSGLLPPHMFDGGILVSLDWGIAALFEGVLMTCRDGKIATEENPYIRGIEKITVLPYHDRLEIIVPVKGGAEEFMEWR
ncbi:MAG: hypothetical protein WC712_11440 [Candidatus Brocadiia bacterium]